jgi:superfamily II DNA or RNA helicase
VRLVFDRGTVVAVDPADHGVLSELPGVLWDPRVRSFRAPAWRHAELAAALSRRGVRFSDRVRDPLERPGAWRAFSLRRYQEEALASWQAAGGRGVVILPTGSGKTRVALAAMARLRVPTLCLVPTRVLLDQWCREVAALYPHAIGRYGDGVREVAAITVSTYESAYRHMEVLGNRFELLVIDEVHHFGAGMRDEALEMCAAPARLGLTATPVADEVARARIAQLVGPAVYALSVTDLAGTFLADFEVVTVPVDLTEEERARHDALVAVFREAHRAFRLQAPGATWSDFTVAASRTADGRRAVHAWRESRRLVSSCAAKRAAIGDLLARHREARVLIFTADNTAAYAIAALHLVMPITCDIDRAERDQALERFRRGELRALVSARVLNEGLDVPDAEIAIITGGSLGAREHVQRIGRLLRPAAGKHAVVYELVARDTVDVVQAKKRRHGLGPRIAPALPRDP